MHGARLARGLVVEGFPGLPVAKPVRLDLVATAHALGTQPLHHRQVATIAGVVDRLKSKIISRVELCAHLYKPVHHCLMTATTGAVDWLYPNSIARVK